MKKILYMVLTLSFFGNTVTAQSNSPYKTKFAIDAPIIVAGIGGAGYGLKLLYDKEAPTQQEINDLAGNKNKVNSFDRFSAGNFSLDAKKLSDYPFYSSFAMPLLLLLDDDISQKAGQTGVLYLETMAISGAMFSLAAGSVDRFRPLMYHPEDNPEKHKRHAKNSFFAGHTAATASATFFAAKIYHDYNPDGTGKFYVWTAAAAIPATVGYLRHRAGKHFLSDNLIGYTLGAGIGILVPQLHKTSNTTGLSITPIIGEYKGVVLSYNIK